MKFFRCFLYGSEDRGKVFSQRERSNGRLESEERNEEGEKGEGGLGLKGRGCNCNGRLEGWK